MKNMSGATLTTVGTVMIGARTPATGLMTVTISNARIKITASSGL
jgi:hypothetical protein